MKKGGGDMAKRVRLSLGLATGEMREYGDPLQACDRKVPNLIQTRRLAAIVDDAEWRLGRVGEGQFMERLRADHVRWDYDEN